MEENCVSGERVTCLDEIQKYQEDFDQRKDNTVVSVPFTEDYAIVCLTEELGEMARCVKKRKRALANGNPEEAEKWLTKLKDEASDELVYLVKLFNKHGWNMADAYFGKMEENHQELDKGGGKFLGLPNTVNPDA